LAVTKRPAPPPLVEVQLTTFSWVMYWRSVLLIERPVPVVIVGADVSVDACVRW
jgi:hypothetical protein